MTTLTYHGHPCYGCAGTRVGRLLRLLRVLRVLKLFMVARKKKLGEETTDSQGEKDFPPSELGKVE